jgi:hypothetical protein
VAGSIVVSGGYEDDKDYGALIVYPGAVGRDSGQASGSPIREFTTSGWMAAGSLLRKSE